MRIELKSKWICIYFRYDPLLVMRVKQIPDREYIPKAPRHWRVPATAWHAARVMELLGVEDEGLKRLAGNKAPALTPAGKKVTDKRLRPYQVKAVQFIRAAGGRAILADDMGLGKTPESLVYAKEEPEIHSMLVIAPASVIYKWKREIETWYGTEAQVLESGKTARNANLRAWVVSYDVARIRADELEELDFDLLILDEFHYIKSPKAQRTRAVKLIAKGRRFVLLLSGTPFLSRPIELFNGLHMVDPVQWPNWYQFGLRYCYTGHSWNGMADFSGASNLEELRERLKSIMIRRLKSDVVDELPTMTRTKMPLKIENMAQYNRVKEREAKAIAELRAKRGSKDYFDNALERLGALKEVVGLGKADAAISWAEDFLDTTDPNRKLVIYAHHDSVVEKLVAGLKSYGVGCIIGSTPKAERNRIQLNFQAGALPRVLIISSAGGVGIDLFGLEGNHISDILFVEREWTSGAEEQAESRLHRQGQEKGVNAWYLIAKGTIDQDNDELIESKRELIGRTIGDNENVMLAVLDRMLKGERE